MSASHCGWRIGALPSLVIFVRLVWLPLWTGIAAAWASGSNYAGGLSAVLWLLVELMAFRWRWTWRTLQRPPAHSDDAEAAAQGTSGDVQRLVQVYCTGALLLILLLAAFEAIAGFDPARALALAAVWVSTNAAVVAHLGIEYRLRGPHGGQMVALLENDDKLIGHSHWAVLLVPRRWRRWAASLFQIGICILVGTFAMAFAVLLEGALQASIGMAFFMVAVLLMMQMVSFSLVSLLEANHAMLCACEGVATQ